MLDLYARTLRNLGGVHPDLVCVIMRALEIGGLAFHVEAPCRPDRRAVNIGYRLELDHAIAVRPIEDAAFAAWLIETASYDEEIPIEWDGWSLTLPGEGRLHRAA